MNAPKNRCKTCYQNDGCFMLKMDMLETKKSLKFMISKCVPQLASHFEDHNLICKECLKNLLIAYRFIEDCILADAQFKKNTNIEILEEISLLSDSSSDDCDSKITIVKQDPWEPTLQFANTAVMIKPYIKTDQLNEITIVEENHDLVMPTVSEESDSKINIDSSSHDNKMTIERTEPKRLKDLLKLLNIENIGQTALPELKLQVNDGIRECDKKYKDNKPMEIEYDASQKQILVLEGAKETATKAKKPEKIVKCLMCDVTARYSSLRKHMKKKHKEPYKCVQCEVEFSHLKFLQKHARTHDEPPPESRVYSCNVCQATFSNHTDFRNHQELHPSWLCELCGKAFSTKTKLSSHKAVHIPTRDLMCYKCGQRFRYSSLLQNHMLSHEEKYKLQCEICGKVCQWRRGLKKHMLSHHEKQFKCDQCNKMFVYKFGLKTHIRLCHLNIKPYQCDECGEKFGRSDYLRRHKRMHIIGKTYSHKSGRPKCQGPFVCNICEKEFPRNELLKAHCNSHLRIRRFQCSSCDLSFMSNFNLKRHEKVHSDDVKFRCVICFNRMTTKEQFDEHMSKHKPKYKCTVCDERFGKMYLMENHRKQRHPAEDLLIQNSIRKKLK